MVLFCVCVAFGLLGECAGCDKHFGSLKWLRLSLLRFSLDPLIWGIRKERFAETKKSIGNTESFRESIVTVRGEFHV